MVNFQDEYISAVDAPQRQYHITTDPFALFAFALLLFTVVVFLLLLVFTQRRSAAQYWESLRSEKLRAQLLNLERSHEDAVPLMSGGRTAGKPAEHQKPSTSRLGNTNARKSVRFSETVDVQSIHGHLDTFDDIVDDWQSGNGHDPEAGRQKSMGERRFHELFFHAV